MFITAERTRDKTLPPVFLNGMILKSTTCAKYLGVIIDQYLKWTQQFQHVAKKVLHGIASIDRTKSELNVNQRKSLYLAFVQPHLDYCATARSAASQCFREKIAVLQRDALRAITNYWFSVTDELYRDIGIDHVFERWKHAEAISPYKIRNANKIAVTAYTRDMIVLKNTSKVCNLRKSVRIAAIATRRAGETTLAMKLKSLFDVFDKSPQKVLGASSLQLFRLWLKKFDLRY